MMRHGLIRLISVMLSILLVLSGSGGAGLAERQKSEAFAPDTVHHGFRVYQVESVRSLGLDLYFMEHEKTGAQLIYVSCDDQNRTFGVVFCAANTLMQFVPIEITVIAHAPVTASLCFNAFRCAFVNLIPFAMCYFSPFSISLHLSSIRFRLIIISYI